MRIGDLAENLTPLSKRAVGIIVTACLSAFALFSLGFSASFCFPESIEQVVKRVPDDSFFYFQIAANFPSSLRFSYDGLHDTYGFQPLWQIVLSAIAPFFESRESLLRVGCMILGIFHTAAGIQLYRLLARAGGPVAGLMAAAFWLVNPQALFWSLGGKENALYALLLVTTLIEAHDRYLRTGAPASRGAALGVLAGLLFLARVNSLTFIVFLGATLALRCAWTPALRRERIRQLGTAGLTAACIAGPWLIYTRIVMGGFLPTSGAFKLQISRAHVDSDLGFTWLSSSHMLHTLSAWPAYLTDLWMQFGHAFGAVFALAAALAVVGVALRAPMWIRAREPLSIPSDWIAAGLLIVWALGNSFVNLLTLPTYVDYGRWYAVPEVLAIAALLGGLAGAASNLCTQRPMLLIAAASIGCFHRLVIMGFWTSPPPSDAVLALIWIGSVAGLALLAAPGRWSTPSLRRASSSAYLFAFWALLAFSETDRALQVDRDYSNYTTENVYLHRLGRWARENLPRDVVLAGYDSGVFTYFSERTVISLEGLVSDREYIESGRKDNLRYLMENRVEYVVGPGRQFEDGSYRFAWLPLRTYEIEWVPFPDVRFWSFHHRNNTYMMVVPEYDGRPKRPTEPRYTFGVVRPRANWDAPGP